MENFFGSGGADKLLHQRHRMGLADGNSHTWYGHLAHRAHAVHAGAEVQNVDRADARPYV